MHHQVNTACSAPLRASSAVDLDERLLQIAQAARPQSSHEWRLGLILGSFNISAWEAAALTAACTAANARILIALVHEPSASAAGRKLSLNRLLRGLDRRVLAKNSGQLKDPLASVDARLLIRDCEWLEIGPPGSQLGPTLIERMAGLNLDAIIQLGCSDLHREVLPAAPAGIWSYRHGGAAGSAGARAVGSAAGRSESAVESRLEALTVHGTTLLCTSWSGVVPYSPYVTQARCYWNSAHLIAQAATRLRSGGANRLCDGPTTMTPPPKVSSISVALKTAFTAASALRAKLDGQHGWAIGVRRRRAFSQRDYENPDPNGFSPIVGRSRSFIADPFVIEHQGTNYIFCEEITSGSERGVISCFTLDDCLVPCAHVMVLERPYHLSYPFLLRDDGDLFMIPETAANRTVQLYRCVDFPGRWDLDTVLLEGSQWVDTTVVQHNGRWWLFSSAVEENANTADDLHLFIGDTIRGPWRAHPLNPIVSDTRRARGAGSFIRIEGALIRPSQDCSHGYGSRTIFNRVRTLTETDYQEEPIGSIGAEWHAAVDGAHTWNTSAELEVIDGPTRARRWNNFPSVQRW